MVLQRILAALAAALMVGAAGLALIAPPEMSLGGGLDLLNGQALPIIQGMTAGWVWQNLALPVLARPLWLLPACAGIIFAGLSFSVSTHQRPQRTPRRRF